GRQGILIRAQTGTADDHPANNNLVGGLDLNAGNVIAYSRGEGVRIESLDPAAQRSGNQIAANSIYANMGLGIDLATSSSDTWPTPNDHGDLDEGPNGLQNYPVLDLVITSYGATLAIGRLDGVEGESYRLDFYANAQSDPSGYGQGKTYIGSRFE